MKTKFIHFFIMICAVFMLPNLVTGQITSFPWSENFDNGGSIPSSWTQDAANVEVWEFKTAAAGHGATADHTTGSGYYAWVDDSNPMPTTATVLISPVFDVTSLSLPYLEFYYWIGDGGTDISTLTVEIFDGTTWQVHADTLRNQIGWAVKRINLTSYSNAALQVKFSVLEDPNSYYGDVCIDDVKFYEPATNDLTVISWETPLTPIAPTAAATVSVKIKNAGSNSQDTFDISYSIDGGTTFIVETYYGTLNAGDTLNHTFATNANLAMGAYNCLATVYNNGDQIATNDTLNYTLFSGTALNGAYTIGSGATDDFNSLADAAAALELFGVTGPVTFNVAAETFNENVSITGPILGMSIVNNLTIKGHGASTIINATSMSNSNRDAFRINAQNYITVDSITIIAASTGNYNTGIRIMASDSITIKNCNITVPVSTNSYFNGIVVTGSLTSNSSATNSNYLKIQNNTVINGYYGFKAYAASANHSTNMEVSNNTFSNYYYYGVYSYYQDSVVVKNNNLESRVGASSPYGFYFYKNYLGSVIANNNIISNNTSSGYGAYMYYCEGSVTNPFMMYNNMISNVVSSSSYVGIYSYYGKNVSYYYNTVNINSGSSTSKALYVNGSATSASMENIKFKNNIFSNKSVGYAVYFNGNYYPAKVTEMDFNNIFAPNASNIARTSSSNVYSDLAGWQASATGLDANSVSVDPGFAGNTDAHAASISMNNLATPIAGIDGDIDGDSRDAATPDMGADEYTPPANDIELVSYLSTNGGAFSYTNAEIIKVVLRNNGTADQVNIPVKYEFNGSTVVIETLASLNSLAIDTFTFTSTIDLSVTGISSLKVYSDLTAEDNRSNDSMFITFEKFGFPYMLDFESSDNGTDMPDSWMGSSSTPLWTIDNDGTGSSLTGPGYDNTTGTSSGKYLYLETSNGSTGDTSYFTSPEMSLSTFTLGASMSFYYHMYGVTTGELFVQEYVNNTWVTIWSISGEQHTGEFEAFTFASVAISSSATKVRFGGVRGSSYTGDIAIDDIFIKELAGDDLAVTALLSPVTTMCESASTPAEIIIVNSGANTQSNVPVTVIFTDPMGVSTTLNGVTSSVGGGVDTVSVGTVSTITPGIYNVKAYATLATDILYTDNDTLMTTFEIAAPFAVDHVETFEDLNNWTPGMDIDTDNGNSSMKYNFYSSHTAIETYMTSKIGPISAGDNLVFDYKVTDYNSTDTILLTNDSMFFMVSNDCGITYDTIFVVDANVHTGSVEWMSKQFPLTAYVGDNIIIGFSGFYGGTGDYDFQIDNYGVATTPMVALGMDTTVCAGDTVMVDAGMVSGYNYMWTVNGDTLTTMSNSIDAVDAGVYTVEVSNPMGMAYDTMMVYHNALPLVSFTGLDTVYCANEMPVMLMGTPVGGTYMGMGITGDYFDPNTAGLGNHVITYSYTDTNGCFNYTMDTTMVDAAPVAVVSAGSEICEGESVDLSIAAMDILPTVFFATYIEGSSNNKGLEIFNATSSTINLDNYRIAQASNGNGWSYYHTFPAGATLAPNMGWVMVTDQVDPTMYDTTLADEVLGYPSLVHFNGDDARAIEYTNDGGSTWMIVDLLGDPDSDPGSAWDVAGVTNATKDHSLYRKANVAAGSLNWATAAGTDSLSSEYVVLAKNDFSQLGNHAYTPVLLDASFLWSNGSTDSTITVMPTTTTTYYVTVSVPNMDCDDYDSVTITVNPMPVVDLGADVTIKWTAGSVNLDAGNVGAMYLWNTGETTQIATYDNTNLANNSATTILVTVDLNGCVASDSVVITMQDDVSIGESFDNANVSIYPNPTNGQFDLTVEGINGNFNMQIVNVTGEVVYTEKLNTAAKSTKSFDISNFAAGVYYVRLSNNDGIVVKKLIIK